MHLTTRQLTILHSRSTRRIGPPSLAGPSLQRNNYPNPGHLGPSSHAAIFSHIYPTQNGLIPAEPPLLAQTQVDFDDLTGPGLYINQTARILEQLVEEFDPTLLKGLVKFWLAKGVNLALAGPVVESCMESATQLLTARPEDPKDCMAIIKQALQQSTQLLTVTNTSTLSDFTDQFCGNSIRCETIGIYLCAVVRASIDIPFYPPLYTTELERRRFCQVTTALCTCALELCLTLDCLNDLQLMFQYEHWIVFSYVYGNQSKQMS